MPEEAALEDSVLADVLLLLMATLAVVVGLRRLRLPLILAFLLVGMIVRPHALGWVEATETTRTLAEFGVVFLFLPVKWLALGECTETDGDFPDRKKRGMVRKNQSKPDHDPTIFSYLERSLSVWVGASIPF